MTFNPKQKYEITSDTISIKDFFDYKDDFVCRPPYQRKSVWSLKKKQSLIDSLFRRFYIPKVIIREVRLDSENTIKEIIDGQQRITTVQEFFSGAVKLPDTLKDVVPEGVGKSYTKLSNDVRKFVDKELKFNADVVKGIDDPKNSEHQEIATEIFWRLQQGESLNYMEIAHARLSSTVRNFIVKYSDDISFDFQKYKSIDDNKYKHEFFKIISRKNDRMQHLALMARFLLIEQAENGIADLTNEVVAQFIDDAMTSDGIDNYSYENKSEAKSVLSNLNTFRDLFKNDVLVKGASNVKELGSEYIIISFYLLLRHLRHYYIFEANEKNLMREFFLEFYTRLDNSDDEDKDVLSFQAHRQQSKENLETRHQILRQLFFDYVKNKNTSLKLKDGKRMFSESERIKIYRRDKGICQMCCSANKSDKEAFVSWAEYEADHIFAHSKGGKSNTENGQVLCRYHNRSKGARLLPALQN